MPDRQKKPTIRTIARKAGVSPTTVSFYLNGHAEEYRLAAETCDRIQRVVDEYKYTPNLHARAMLEKRTYLVGVVIGAMADSFWADLYEGLEETLEAAGYHILVGTSRDDPARERKHFEFMRAKGVDGFIYTPVMLDYARPAFDPQKTAAGAPVVAMLHPVPDVPSVYTDHPAACREVAQNLLSRGHKRIAYIGPFSSSGLTRSDERYLAFRETLLAGGAAVSQFPTAADFLAKAGDFTAAFCYSSGDANRIDEFLRQRGGKDKLSLVSYGGTRANPLYDCGMARVIEPQREIGALAGRLLLDIFDGKDVATVMPPAIFEPRQSIFNVDSPKGKKQT
jgi:DNA-binding LacI/PurR family transcriptional regulator